ncbi:hypothetical protein FA13DRAFT_1752644 [Coprinellus micaceus]|uniref:DUF1766-domain-containing protein n=1 Tax=Coprinellus micaceus TaxID=71717 RepID=A0A4Y7TP40_COPMI|nr:hypothetical protein FA13DRAFT_1752644 [Coprinellus micaceus]
MHKLSRTDKFKEAATDLLTKLLRNDSEDTPPKPPPKPSAQQAWSEPNALAHSFNGLHVSEPPTGQLSPGFVGGFHPAYLPGIEASFPARPALSAPPSMMPVPFAPFPPPDQPSLTMQMALDPNVQLAPRPSSTPTKPTKPTSPKPNSPSKPHLPHKPVSDTTPSKPSSSKPAGSKPNANATPTKPKPNRVSLPQTPPKKISSTPSSAPSTPSGKAGQVQCSGTTKAGKRCTRMVKAAPALEEVIEDGEDGESNPPLERFCHQHAKELLSPSGCYARKNGEWIDFGVWIPAYLQTETQLALRVEMERTRSRSDVDGYIYTFEIREEGTETIKLKVGRAVNLVKRIDEWGKQCGSKEQVLRGYYPGPETLGEEGEQEVSLMKGRVRAGEKSPCCHRLERLVHLELADLTATCTYLHPSWPHISEPATTVSGGKTSRERCEDCGSLHKEIFEFQRWTGANKNKEWEEIVKPVIERWGRFVENYV